MLQYLYCIADWREREREIEREDGGRKAINFCGRTLLGRGLIQTETI